MTPVLRKRRVMPEKWCSDLGTKGTSTSFQQVAGNHMTRLKPTKSTPVMIEKKNTNRLI